MAKQALAVAGTVEKNDPTPMEVAQEETQVFILEDQEIRLVSGKTKKLARCSWGKEIRIMEAMKSVMANVIETGLLKPGQLTETEATFTLLTTVFGKCPEALTKIVGSLVDENEEWVKENLDLEEMLSLVIPFLHGKSKQVAAVFGRHSQQLQGLTRTLLS